jgi:hypothetical protein
MLKNAKGPKPGATRSNQTAKLEPETVGAKASKLIVKPDAIKAMKITVDGSYMAVEAGSGASLVYPRTLTGRAELAKLAAVGASFKALQAWLKTNKPEAKLATGLDGRNAPQSAMAAAESRAGAKADVPAPTAGKAKATAKVSMKGDFSYAVGKANDTRPDTWTHYMVALIQKHTDTASAKSAHAKTGKFVGKKLDFTWCRDKKGFIK